MPRGKDSGRSGRLNRETQRLLDESRKELRYLDISEQEASENIHNFLDHLDQFDNPDSFSDAQDSDND